MAVSSGGRLWAAWFSGKTPEETIERCPHAYVLVSTSGDGGRTWKEVLAIDPDGAGSLEAYARVKSHRTLVTKEGTPRR